MLIALTRYTCMKIKCQLICLVLGVFCFCSVAFSDVIDQQRQNFLMAEKMLAQGNEPAFLALSSNLVSYPLYPYLQYQWLKTNLIHSACGQKPQVHSL